MKKFNKSIAIVMITRSGTLWNGSCSIMHGYSHDLFGSIKLVFISDYIGNLDIEMEAGNYYLIINLLSHKDSIKVKRINLYLCTVAKSFTNNTDVSFSFVT